MAFKVKASRYVEVCKKTLARPTRYQNSFPKNCGYYDGQYLWGDCWCFNPKTIIWGEAAGTPVCDNYRVGQTIDVATGIRNSGLPDTTGDQIMSKYCTQVSFAKMLQDKKAPCLLLIDGRHMGAYIGDFTQNGKTYNTCEYTPNPALGNGLCPSYVDQNGARRVCKGGTILGYWSRAGYLTAFVDYTDTQIKPVANRLNTQDLANAIMTGYVHGYKVGNGQDRINNLKAMGYTEAEIKAAQDVINKKAAEKNNKLSAEDLANAILSGVVNGKKIGNGQQRINNLKALGYTDAEIRAAQNIVNKKVAQKNNKLTAEELAKAILAGNLNGKKIGNGQERINNLKAAGYTDAEIRAAQDIVNKTVAGTSGNNMESRKNIAKNMPAIQNGSKGEAVKVLQKALRTLGFYAGDIDGSAGPMTVAAIKAAQKAWGLTVDGSFGPACWNKLLQV